MLICNNQLNDKQLDELDHLSSVCLAMDKGLPTIYRHLLSQKRATDNNLLYYQDDNLVGFLSVYFFYAHACELSLIVDPKHRRQGVAKQLLQTIMPLLIAKQIPTVIFSMPPMLNDTWLPTLGFIYQNSEYHMQRHSYEPILITKQALSIRKATPADIPTLCAIDEACFANVQSDMPERFNNLFNDKHYTLLLALKNDTPVGKAHIRWQKKEAIFSDIAVIPQYQGQGWGGELLSYCINYTLTLGKSNLTLDVETSNRNALNLYSRHGFKTSTIHDYWSIDTQKLHAILFSIA